MNNQNVTMFEIPYENRSKLSLSFIIGEIKKLLLNCQPYKNTDKFWIVKITYKSRI